MKEKDMAGYMGRFIREFHPTASSCYEYKLVKQRAFRFDSVAPHQVDALLQSISGGFYRKEPDMAAISGFSGQKPFDAYYMVAKEAFVVVMFYEPRKPKAVFFIPIKEFINLRKVWPRKSIRKEDLLKLMTDDCPPDVQYVENVVLTKPRPCQHTC